MASTATRLAEFARKVDEIRPPESRPGLVLMPVAADRVHARWSLLADALEDGRRSAAPEPDRSHLVLRVFSLPPGEEHEFSPIWHDFAIDPAAGGGYFDIPAPAQRVNAAVGLVNAEGRFHPLLRGRPAELPAPTPLEKPTPDAPPTPHAEATAEASPKAKRPRILDEDEIAARLNAIRGLPETFKATPTPSAEAPQPPRPTHGHPSPERTPRVRHTHALDEQAVLAAVRRALAEEPDPHIQPSAAPSATTADPHPPDSAAERLASQWADLWSGRAPIELRAQCVLRGRVDPGFNLLLGSEIMIPTPSGDIIWRRNLERFDEVWPLLRAALDAPVVPAEPALRFFREAACGGAGRLLELHATLEIEGRVADPAYRPRLPEGLAPDAEGRFRLSRVLPHGAVILPGMSLVGSSSAATSPEAANPA